MRWYTPTSIWIFGASVGACLAELTGELAALPAGLAAGAWLVLKLERP